MTQQLIGLSELVDVVFGDQALAHEPIWEGARRNQSLACTCGGEISEPTWKAVYEHRRDALRAALAAEVHTAVHVDPDCAAGKHRACPGYTFDDQADQHVPCECVCHDPNGPTP